MFFGIREKKSYWSWTVDTQVTYTSFGLTLPEREKREPHIGDMKILLYLRLLSITPNAMMTQTKKFIWGN